MPDQTPPDRPLPWYCVRAQPRRQNVASAHLRSFGVEVFNPQLLVRKAGRAGVMWRSEPLFPNYLFARFDFGSVHRRVHYAFGVSGLVRFGERYAEVSASEIDPLRAEWGASESLTVDSSLEPGDRVRLSGALISRGGSGGVVPLAGTAAGESAFGFSGRPQRGRSRSDGSRSGACASPGIPCIVCAAWSKRRIPPARPGVITALHIGRSRSKTASRTTDGGSVPGHF